MPEQEITERNQELLSEILVIVRRLEADWARYRPVVEAFQRGGFLAARTAAKVARNGQNV